MTHRRPLTPRVPPRRGGFTLIEVLVALGITAIALTSDAVLRTPATGVVEATMTSGATGMDSKLYEHLKYYYDLQAWLPKNMVIVNRKAFDALDKPTQTAVMNAAAAAEARGLAASKRVDTESKAKLKANGMQVLEPSAQLKADMKKVGETMLTEWLEKSGADGQALLANFKR